MKTYLRIIAYAKANRLQVVLYLLFILLSVIFLGLTFSMLQPLLDLLFNGGEKAQPHPGDLRFSIEYLKDWML
ncbi:MAG: ABC transporter ATP-binding protein, partial [Bacteroidota bacterium]|nr:ABC transporter ATP-binding protein [Bacteroidota bacterium]